MPSTEQYNIVIVGGGIIGCTTAYYLSHHAKFAANIKVTILEASRKGVAQGASGKAGGLVAKWAYPKELVKESFREHVRLAEKHNGAQRWGWRFVNCGSWEGRGEPVRKVKPEDASPDDALSEKKSLEKTVGLGANWKHKKRAETGLPGDLDWVKEDLTDSYSPMAPARDTGQVHPYLFTTSMLELAQEKGVELIPGKATSINIDTSRRVVTGVRYTHQETNSVKTLPASHVILAAGAWSPYLLPSLPISATRAHSITIHPKPSVTVSPYVLFTEILLQPSPSSGRSRAHTATPEIYARPDNEVYCCGPGDDSILPGTVDDVEVDEGACQSILEHVSSISEELREGEVDKRQACFLPTVRTGGGPIVGEASRIAKGLIVATGHTCWGICNAPGTAKAITELIMDGKVKCANLSQLEPGRFL